jgi:hypothetical protein
MKTGQKLDSVRRQACLAGIGVVDTGREIAVEKFDKFFVDGSAFINKLFAKGESLEAQLQAKLRGREMMEDKIAYLRGKLGMRSVNREQQLENLSTKVDTLIDVVAKLALQKAAAKPVAKATAKPSAKATAKPAAKAAAKPAAKAAAKPAAKAAAKPTAKAAAKPAATAAAKPTAKAAAKPAVKAAAKPADSEATSKPQETKAD